MVIMTQRADIAPPCPEPSCGLPPTQVTERDLSPTEHMLLATCKRGHLWETKWFAERGA